MSTFITELDVPSGATGLRLAVKDIIDVAGVPSTAGSRAWMAAGRGTRPAAIDAACLAGARAAGARLVGKLNMHELAYGAQGVNPFFGTPRNPFGDDLVPGGSSSGSAVVVAEGGADVALGTDTGGSVRVPAACCGVVGLKTTWGRIPLGGCMALAPGLDTIGPLARDVAGIVRGMELLCPGFSPGRAATVVGRVRGYGEVDPAIDAAVDAALAATEWEVVEVRLDRFEAADRATRRISAWEAFGSLGWLLDGHGELLGRDVAARLEAGSGVTAARVAASRATVEAFREDLHAAFERVQVLALPTMAIFAPPVAEPDSATQLTTLTRAINGAGVPALALPIPVEAAAGGRPRGLPASLQLVTPWGADELACASALVAEAAIAR